MIPRLLLSVIAFSLVQPALGATYGLVVGINTYDAEKNLGGAVDDARDIETALKTFGAERIITLLDREATRAAIGAAYDELLNQASQGDTLIFSYAGHGSQAPAKVPEEEEDGKDEFFLLSSFDRTKPETQGEMILDDELRGWMKRAEDKGVKVVLVADSCHSGGMARAVTTNFRYAPPVEMALGTDSLDAVVGAGITEEQLRSAMFLSASLESQQTPEVRIEGKLRGALSYAFARALDSDVADTNGDKQVSRIELEEYIVKTVKSEAEMLQTPVIRPRAVDLMDEVILTRSLPTPEPEGDPNAPVEIPTIPFSVSNGPAVALQGVVPGDASGYRWNAATLEFCSPLGEVVAFDVAPEQLQNVVDKARIVELLKRVAASSTGKVELEPVQALYIAGERVALSAPGWPNPTAVVFNLANTGEVQFVAESARKEGRDVLEIGRSSVIAPYGGDHLVVISLETRTPGLGVFMQRQPAPSTTELLGALPLFLAGQKPQVAIQPLYTAATKPAEGEAPEKNPCD